MASHDETETVITWTAADERATVYTLMPRVARLCQHAGGEEIRKEEGIRAGKKEAWTFLVDPACIVIRPRRKPSAAQIEAARKAVGMARKHRNTTVGAVIGDPNAVEAG